MTGFGLVVEVGPGRVVVVVLVLEGVVGCVVVLSGAAVTVGPGVVAGFAVVVVVVRGAPPGTVTAGGGAVVGGAGGIGGTGTVCGPTVVDGAGMVVVVVVLRGDDRSDDVSRVNAKTRSGTMTTSATANAIVDHTHTLGFTGEVCPTR